MKSKPRYRMISWVAERYDVHPQTLLLTPRRSRGNTRLFDEETCDRLETILTLTRELGVNLAGVEIILNLREQVGRLSRDLELLAQVLQQRIREENGVPRYHALVKVETGTIQPLEGE